MWGWGEPLGQGRFVLGSCFGSFYTHIYIFKERRGPLYPGFCPVTVEKRLQACGAPGGRCLPARCHRRAPPTGPGWGPSCFVSRSRGRRKALSWLSPHSQDGRGTAGFFFTKTAKSKQKIHNQGQSGVLLCVLCTARSPRFVPVPSFCLCFFPWVRPSAAPPRLAQAPPTVSGRPAPAACRLGAGPLIACLCCNESTLLLVSLPPTRPPCPPCRPSRRE